MKRAETQLSLKEMLAIVALLGVLFSILGTGIELRREANRRRCACLPALRQGHPYWSTPEGQRVLAAAERDRLASTSFVEYAWRDKSPAAAQFRATCALTTAFVACLALRDVTRWRSGVLKRRSEKDRHASK